MDDSEQAYPMVLDPVPRPAARASVRREVAPAPAAEGSASVHDEEDWVIASQAGDRSAFEQIVRQTARLVFSRLYLETGDAHRAEDLVQETFLAAWRNIRQLTEPRGLRQWLFSIAFSVRVDAARRDRRKKRGGRDSKGMVPDFDAMRAIRDPRPGPEETAELAERRRQVLAVLQSMPEEYRDPIALRYLGGADYETIGRELGLSNGSLRGLLNRGMSRLREMMKELDI